MLSSRAFNGPPPEGSNSPFNCSANMISTENKEVKNFHTHGLLIDTNQNLSNVVQTSSKAGLDPHQESTVQLHRHHDVLLCYDNKAERGHVCYWIRLSGRNGIQHKGPLLLFPGA